MRMTNLHEKVVEMKKGPWSREEDQKLFAYIEEHGHGSWRSLPEKAGLQRCGKSCRLRWTNYLRPDIKRGKFTSHEDKTIIRLHALLGNRWSAIATHMPKRTDNEIKNRWNTRLKKRLSRMGIDPATHKPKNDPSSSSAQSRQAANLNHLTQWETARLEAEERLARESQLLSKLRKATMLRPLPPPQPPRPRCLDILKIGQATANKNGFFALPGSIESPTSTLNFSSNSSTVPTVEDYCNLFVENDVVSDNYSGAGGLIGDECKYDYNGSGRMDFIPVGDYDDNYGSYEMGNFMVEDNMDHWNELLNMVTSPMQSPLF